MGAAAAASAGLIALLVSGVFSGTPAANRSPPEPRRPPPAPGLSPSTGASARPRRPAARPALARRRPARPARGPRPAARSRRRARRPTRVPARPPARPAATGRPARRRVAVARPRPARAVRRAPPGRVTVAVGLRARHLLLTACYAGRAAGARDAGVSAGNPVTVIRTEAADPGRARVLGVGRNRQEEHALVRDDAPVVFRGETPGCRRLSFSSKPAMTPMRRGDGRMTSWVVWAVTVAVSGLIGFTATHYSVRTLRYVTAGNRDRPARGGHRVRPDAVGRQGAARPGNGLRVRRRPARRGVVPPAVGACGCHGTRRRRGGSAGRSSPSRCCSATGRRRSGRCAARHRSSTPRSSPMGSRASPVTVRLSATAATAGRPPGNGMTGWPPKSSSGSRPSTCTRRRSCPAAPGRTGSRPSPRRAACPAAAWRAR